MMAFLMGLPTIDPATLRRRMEAEPIAIFDVNAPASFREARIPGARPLDPDGYSAAQLPSDLARGLVFYCANPYCRKAPRAAKRALALGHQDVRVLSAGITGWLAAGFPVESGA